MVGVDILGVPGDHHIRFPGRHHPGDGQGFVAPAGEARVGKIQELRLCTYHPSHSVPVLFADAGHFVRWGLAKLAGQFTPGEPENLAASPRSTCLAKVPETPISSSG